MHYNFELKQANRQLVLVVYPSLNVYASGYAFHCILEAMSLSNDTVVLVLSTLCNKSRCLWGEA